jgi:hypothetical protein
MTRRAFLCAGLFVPFVERLMHKHEWTQDPLRAVWACATCHCRLTHLEVCRATDGQMPITPAVLDAVAAHVAAVEGR